MGEMKRGNRERMAVMLTDGMRGLFVSILPEASREKRKT